MSEGDDLFRTVLSWGLIIRADLETINEIRKFLAERGVRVLYQRVDAGGLWIVKKEEGRG